MTAYTVYGYERISKFMRVEADSPEEAVEKAKLGDYTNCDIDPGPNVFSPKWHAVEGWLYGNPRP